MKSVMQALAASLLLVVGCAESMPQPRAPTSRALEALRVPWTFEIQDKERRPIAILSVRFTDAKASSCIGDNWKLLDSLSFESLGKPEFPGRDVLSYQVDGDKLIIGRNDFCDDYYRLSGELTPSGLTGEYYAFGFGPHSYQQLGYVIGKPSK